MRIKLFFILGIALCPCFGAEPVTLVDFTEVGHGWRGNPRTQMISQDGVFVVELTGDDPWVEGPAVAVPAFGKAEKLKLTLDAQCSSDGGCQIFYAPAGQGFSAEAMVALERSPSGATTYTGMIPLLAGRMRFRIDPPGTSGRFTLRTLQALPLIPMAAPAFVKPVPVVFSDNMLTVEAGPVRVVHNDTRWNAFVCFINDQKMAESNPSETLAYWNGQQVITVPLTMVATSVKKEANGFTVSASVRDAGGALWQMKRRFANEHGAIRVETSLAVSKPRAVIHLPWLTLFAGVGSFGESKNQALLPGVEYLADEPSSNQKEIKGAAANRRIIDSYKLCYPMMAIAAAGRWFSVTWGKGDLPVSPIFDSPDRIFNSGGHLLGLWSPAVGKLRLEGETVVYGGVNIKAGVTYSSTVLISGGKGALATDAIKDYVQRSALPDIPKYNAGFEGAVKLLTSGWLDSAAREGNRWRHAVWGKSFAPAVADDVPAYLLWLAAYTPNTALKVRLEQTAREVIASLPKGTPGINGISHVKRLTGALLYGDLKALVTGAAQRVKKKAVRLAANGGVACYTPAKDKPDYASTLGSNHCNGFTAMSMEGLLQDATLTGDESTTASALSALDQLTANYAGQVPHGAQPWEMPLHTPDIVASARLVRCYVLGYLLSGHPAYLDQARYWAWTGVAMVYLASPVDGDVGLYATIGVIGATNWTAPNWIGQPVQWCGLVYRSALEDLARVDKELGETWRKIARGITISGVQMTFPADDPQGRGGLLPDYFLLKSQIPDGPAINPGTLQAHLAEAFGKTPMSTITRLSNGMLVHVPGTVVQKKSATDSVKLSVTAWPEGDYRILITRLAKAPAKVIWNDKPVSSKFFDNAHAIIVTLSGCGTLEIKLR